MMLFENVLCTELKIISFIYCMERTVGFWKLYGLLIISLSFSCQVNWIFHLV